MFYTAIRANKKLSKKHPYFIAYYIPIVVSWLLSLKVQANIVRTAIERTINNGKVMYNFFERATS